ncbi:hypothetical protein F5878DRAFT_643489 [Lentinula raphanica]|uniref:Bacteriophage T5 Orf172 DNA-binding domain-containing protein n=1 Tax=Lentinula raphanica TaxID=153919 RepID=A0AA38P536_9AGAR|nr:hypothetical protein F5878DRAFT_643489 [Lentinula raphanica]
MVRRSSRLLHLLYNIRKARPTSRADGPGFLYAFVDHGHCWKIGMARDFDRRRAQWDRECPCIGRRWMPPLAVTRRRRAESLAHLLLEINCADRPKDYCNRCRKRHIEVFHFVANRDLVWRTIVYPLLLQAARA